MTEALFVDMSRAAQLLGCGRTTLLRLHRCRGSACRPPRTADGPVCRGNPLPRCSALFGGRCSG